MIGLTLSFVFLLVFLPSIVLTLKCSYGGTCEPLSKWNTKPPKLTTNKNCKESCVFFYCYFGQKYVKHGYGCLEDFERLCPHSLIKEYNINYWTFHEGIAIFSCNNSDNCAIKKSKEWSSYVTPAYPKDDPYADEKCIYDGDEENTLLASEDILFEEKVSDIKIYLSFLISFIVALIGSFFIMRFF